MKTWNKPKMETLEVRLTASGSDPSTQEAYGYIGCCGWVCAKYDSVHYKKCQNGQITPKDNNELLNES